ncbi:hypothetical protein PLICRDRAFT_700814 [Plicaturopsis crispa FD-325 SS-3]|nr:hypothetical protein PLICRDRAFT_700814 [Plicaturopsis crispa FD-325 SS-3]
MNVALPSIPHSVRLDWQTSGYSAIILAARRSRRMRRSAMICNRAQKDQEYKKAISTLFSTAEKWITPLNALRTLVERLAGGKSLGDLFALASACVVDVRRDPDLTKWTRAFFAHVRRNLSEPGYARSDDAQDKFKELGSGWRELLKEDSEKGRRWKEDDVPIPRTEYIASDAEFVLENLDISSFAILPSHTFIRNITDIDIKGHQSACGGERDHRHRRQHAHTRSHAGRAVPPCATSPSSTRTRPPSPVRASSPASSSSACPRAASTSTSSGCSSVCRLPAESLHDRVQDCASRVLITSDVGRRGGKTIATKAIVDAALKERPKAEHVLVLQRTGNDVAWTEGRDKWWHEEIAKVPAYCAPEIMSSEGPLFILYASGSTGRPKGVYVFDVHPEDRFACMADVGWITGHTYIVYGPLANGVATMVFESMPVSPTPSRYWQAVEKHKIAQFYSAPTAIRLLPRLGSHHVENHDLSSLRVLGSVGEPINPETWD